MEIKSKTLTRLSHPGVPKIYILIAKNKEESDSNRSFLHGVLCREFRPCVSGILCPAPRSAASPLLTGCSPQGAVEGPVPDLQDLPAVLNPLLGPQGDELLRKCKAGAVINAAQETQA